ncbi:CocE/NonD family hydrolase [Flavobacterium caeni]|uniref:Xaa-Pro dipeptidyl-peptidase C-terminal domain-containing protein n=1 Tax=Flavobacterium caeni TaxID=490189 RepID=A0A1G5AV05_9FLAO|nr:CocE/NonD family hydrolase [Flavobacterium caeni]SCX81693.1 hypothetical protein SAMN02927903_00162 [Flavobacterium caeni]
MRRIGVYGVAMALACAFSGNVRGQSAAVLSDSLFVIRDSVEIPTRSGIPISAIVVRKKGNDAPLPAVLFYTTYFQGPKDAVLGKRSAIRDYVGVVAYARGIRTNLKHYAPYEHESGDLYDIIDWVAKQSWCDGRVGMLGGSYTGFAQWAAAKKRHPALKTIVPQVAVMPGFDAPMENNVPIGNVFSWAHENIYRFPAIGRGLVFEWFNAGSSFRGLDSLEGHPSPIFQKWLAHPAYDAYWRSLAPTDAEYAQIDIPILSTTGYYDGSQIGALQYYKSHLKNNPNAEHYLVIGPYDHWGGQRNAASNLMGYDIDPVAQVNMGDLAYQWMDYIMKAHPKPDLLRDKVNYEVMGGNHWKHAPSVDKMANNKLKFYLNGAKLSSKPDGSRYVSQTVDFKDRENQNAYYTPTIVFDTLDVSNGRVFVGEPFAKSIEISGSFEGELCVTINKKDMDVSLAFYELTANGKYFFLTRYVGRASYAKDRTKRSLIEPGRRTKIPLAATRVVSKKMEKGSRLVVLLNVNKHPFEVVNYGSGKEVSDETIDDAGAPLEVKWHGDSFISVPIWED